MAPEDSRHVGTGIRSAVRCSQQQDRANQGPFAVGLSFRLGRGDVEEIRTFGYDNFQHVLTKAVYNAFRRFVGGAKPKGLHLERVQSKITTNYRLAPRVYTTHSTGHY